MSDKTNSSDDEPLEITDFSRQGPFEEVVAQLAQFMRSALRDFGNEVHGKNETSQQQSQQQSSSSSSPFFFQRDLVFSVGLSLQGIDDFETRLHGTRNNNNSNSGDTNNQQKLVATLQIMFPEDVTDRRIAELMANDSNNNNAVDAQHNILLSRRSPLVGLCGLAAFLFLRPLDRSPNLSHQLCSTLLSLGLGALDELGPQTLNVTVVAPVANKSSMNYRGVGKFRVVFDKKNDNKDDRDDRNRHEELLQQQAQQLDVHGVSFALASPFAGRQSSTIASLLPLVLNGDSSSNNTNAAPATTTTTTTTTTFGTAAIDIASRTVRLSDRAFAGLGYLDGIVDAFVQSCGHQTRFVKVRAFDVGMRDSSAASSSSPGKKKQGGSSSSSSSRPSRESQLEGTVWADASRVYRCPVLSRSRWRDAVLASWDSHPNGHDRAAAGILLGFDNGCDWSQSLAGMPSLPIGCTESPIESFSVELLWSFLRVDTTSVTDNETVSWFDEVVQHLFLRGGGAADEQSRKGSSSGNNSTAKRTFFGFGSRSSNNPKNSNEASSSTSSAGGAAAAASSSSSSSAAVAALGQPTCIHIAPHLRHRSEFSSRIKGAFEQSVREIALKVLSAPLDDARRRYYVSQSANNALDSAGAVRAAFLKRGKDVVGSIREKVGLQRAQEEEAERLRQQQQQQQQNNWDDTNDGSEGVRSAISSWVGALWTAGSTAVAAAKSTALDALRAAHPEELIVSRKSLLAAHTNSILAALRQPDSARHLFVVSLPENNSSRSSNNKSGKQPKKPPNHQHHGTIPSVSSLRPTDIRRHVPPGTVLSRFACEARTMKHVDELRELFMTLVDVLREVLTGTKAQSPEMEEEYQMINALQLCKEEHGQRMRDHQRRAQLARDPMMHAASHQQQHSAASTLSSSNRAARAEMLLRCLLVEFEEEGVDCCADIVHQKFQALALCANAIVKAEKRKQRRATSAATGASTAATASSEATAAEQQQKKREIVSTPRQLIKKRQVARQQRRRSSTSAAVVNSDEVKEQQTPQREQQHDDDEPPLYAPPADVRFIAPITFGDRETVAAAHSEGQQSSSSSNSAGGGGQASQMLFRDMLDFLRANRYRRGGVTLADFLAWFSPSDVGDFSNERDRDDDEQVGDDNTRRAATEKEAELIKQEEAFAKASGAFPLGFEFLSSRMRPRGNAWREAWQAASKIFKAKATSSPTTATANAAHEHRQEHGGDREEEDDDDDDSTAPLLEALRILDWLRERPAHEIAYVALKGQAAAAATQLLQHPVFAALDSSSAAPQHFMAQQVAATAYEISATFPQWEDFVEALVIEVEKDATQLQRRQAQERQQQQQQQQHLRDGGSPMSVISSDEDDENDGRQQQKQQKQTATTQPPPLHAPVFESVAPEIAFKLSKLFRQHVLELEKAEYLLCIAISVCDSVSPFGSSSGDSPGLFQIAQRLALSAFEHVQRTDPRFTPHSEHEGRGEGNNSTAATTTMMANHCELPADWESAIYTADHTGRIADPVQVDSSLFFRSGMCTAWFDSHRGSESSLHAQQTVSGKAKPRPPLTKRYRVYGYTQRMQLQSSSLSTCNTKQQQEQQQQSIPLNMNMLPPVFQRVVTHVDCSHRTALMVSLNTKVV